METATLNNEDVYCTGDLSAEQLVSEDCSNREPKLLLHIGDEYQAEIPALVTKDQYVPFDYGLRLSLPVTWINDINRVSEGMKDVKKNFSSHSTDAFHINDPLICESVEVKTHPYQSSSNMIAPGICGDSWVDIEEASFLLGLYIFKKKFDQLKRFIGSKKMEDILLFYYGKFHRSIEYSRWTTCRKENIRRRKCVCGEQIFSGLRQQELLSRLLPQVSEESKEVLTEVSRTFAEGDMSLVDYAFSLKDIVGLRTLVEAVAIGKGKHDLTGNNFHPDIPVGKACSSLTCAQIVNLLTGDFRLSKARSNDLFWEAVWPRLLARGWHSDQPKNHSLVFLTPGIRNFSKGLRKGKQYYDSVTDVLSKVGSEPELLELDTGKNEGQKTEESEWFEETTKQENLPEKRHCYLQPPTASSNMDVVRFTVVDTSLAIGKSSRVTELRTLPKNMLQILTLSEDSNNCTSEVSYNKSDFAHDIYVDQEEKNTITNPEILSDSGKTLDSSSSEQLIQISGLQRNEFCNDHKQTRKAVKNHLKQKLNQNEPASVPKRQKTITACNNEEISSGKFAEDVHCCCSNSHDLNNKVGSLQDRFSITSPTKESSPQCIGGAQVNGVHGLQNPQFRILIDLNLPQQPVEFEDGIFITDSANMQNDIESKEQQDDFCAPKASLYSNGPEHPAIINSRRQSTRNRPPTARALEALVNGYLTAPSRRKKDSDADETDL